MKKQLSMLLAAGMAVSMLAGCGGTSSTTTSSSGSTATGDTGSSAAAEATGDSTAITLWTYPIGSFGDAATVDALIAKFNEKHPEISVTVEYLDYTNGDDQVTAAIEAGTTPDIIMEGPERLVSNWGAKGKMLPLNDLWTDEAVADISATSENVVSACKWTDGNYYEYPLCMTTHTMAINKEMFEEAGALQYINEDGTWTTENFEKALQALKDSGVSTTAIVYCGGQGGDQGTRALVNNLYSGQFTNADHTAYTADSDANKQALQQLVDWVDEGLITYDAAAQASGQRAKVDIRYYRVIYDAIDEIEAAMKGMLAPKFQEVVIGHAEVRMTYKVSAVGTIAGCMVKDGKVTRDAKVRVLRDNIVIHEGEVGSLQRFKDAAKEVTAGYECGMSILKFNDIKEGDIFECFAMEQIKL